MKILTDKQIREADRFTIEHEPVDSIDLMERASEVIAQWFCNHIPMDTTLWFLIGKGNNGGDGLAVARMLYHVGYNCTTRMLFDRSELSEECRFNLERLPEGVQKEEWKPDGKGNVNDIPADAVIVDAILGTGVRGDLKEPLLSVIRMVNELPNRVVSIDLPSGMRTEFGNDAKPIIHAQTTLALEFPKLAMLLPEAGEACGAIEVLPIELDPRYFAQAETPYRYLTPETIRTLVRPRPKFGHKGTFGHALLVCGSEGMAGAGVLATGAALRSGCGMVTLHTPREERFAVQANHPSALLSPDPGRFFTQVPANLERFDAVGIGCGIGLADQTRDAFGKLLAAHRKPMVLDADALTLIANNRVLRNLICKGSILTPHPGELRRLVGEWGDERGKIERVISLAAELQSIVVVKGAHTMICMPDGQVWFNSTGTSGMAKGGSGDVLAGLLTGLLARGYDPSSAALLGVYLHGRAGELCAAYYGAEAMNSADLLDFLAEARQEVE